MDNTKLGYIKHEITKAKPGSINFQGFAPKVYRFVYSDIKTGKACLKTAFKGLKISPDVLDRDKY